MRDCDGSSMRWTRPRNRISPACRTTSISLSRYFPLKTLVHLTFSPPFLFFFFFGFQCVYVVFQFCSWFGRQEAYFKCAYECFGGRKDYGVVNNCVEHCSVPVISAQNLVESEMAKFQVAFYSLCELPFNEMKFRAWLLLKVESYFRAAFLTKLVKYKLPTSQ